MSKIKQLVESMEPDKAASEIAMVMKNLFPLLSEEVSLKFVAGVAGDSSGDKLTRKREGNIKNKKKIYEISKRKCPGLVRLYGTWQKLSKQGG